MLSSGPAGSAKKSLPLSSTTMNAGKSRTSIGNRASMPSSGYSSTSTRVMQDLLLELAVAEPVPGRRTRGGQRVQVLRRRVLGGLQRELGAGPADHDGQVVRRARGGTERAD